LTITVVLKPNSADAYFWRAFGSNYAVDATKYWWIDEYGNNKLGNRDILRVGYDFDASKYKGWANRGCLTFTRGSIPLNAIVTEARLQLYCTFLWLQNVPFKPIIYAYRILNEWKDHDVDWRNIQFSPSASANTEIDKQYKWFEWNVTNDVNNFLATNQWFGWLLKAKNETPTPLKSTIAHSCMAFFAGKEYSNSELQPRLIVTYESEKTILMPSLERSIFQTPTFYIEALKTGFVKPSNLRVTINYGNGIPTFRVRIPDPSNKLFKRLKPLDEVKIWVYDGAFKLLMRGVIIQISNIFEKTRFVELEGFNYSYYLLIREKNDKYEDREVSDIVFDLAKLAPEIETKYYIVPTAKTVSKFSAYESIFNNLIELAKIASLTGEEYAFWVCEGIHNFENRPNIHFQPINKEFNLIDLSFEDCLEISFTQKAPQANKLNIRWDYWDLNKVKTVEAAEKEVLIEKTLWNYYIKDEKEAEAWGNAQLQEMQKEGFNIEAIIPLNVNFEPGKLIKFHNENENLLLKIVEVEHIYSEKQALTKLTLKS
jgi:hypothetical protein